MAPKPVIRAKMAAAARKSKGPRGYTTDSLNFLRGVGADGMWLVIIARAAFAGGMGIQIPVVTGMGEARNVVIARTADALIAVGGEYGTLSEIAFGLKVGKPVVSLHSWNIDPQIERASSPKDAVDRAMKTLGGTE